MQRQSDESSEEKKKNFRNYLEERGVTKTMTEIFNKIIQAKEKPENPIDFVRQELGGKTISEDAFNNLDMELEAAQREIQSLRKSIEALGLSKLLEEDARKGDEDKSAIEYAKHPAEPVKKDRKKK